MPKHKPKRGSPLVDMTAMTDVAFLLLTFFMLTAKAKPQETLVVDTPASISQTILPDVGTLTVLVGEDGRIFLDMAGQFTRADLIDTINLYHNLKLTKEQKVRFSNLGSFGVPRSQLKEYISLDPTARAKFKATGIPVDTADISKNELADWIYNARLAQFRMKKKGTAKDDYVIVVKADKNTPYPAIQKVINTLVDINVNKFNLITSLESDPNKTEAAKGGGG